jgi:hypothetical protein
MRGPRPSGHMIQAAASNSGLRYKPIHNGQLIALSIATAADMRNARRRNAR